MNDETLKKVKEMLAEINEKGSELLSVLKKKYSQPVVSFGDFRSVGKIYVPKKYADSQILVKPNLFYFSLFENFWKLMRFASDNIVNPVVLPWVRVIMEQSLGIYYYSQKKESEKKDLACKYWLCTLAFLGGKYGNLDYNYFLDLLNNKKDKSKFLKLKDEGYPVDKVHNYWKDNFVAINRSNLPGCMDSYFLNLKGNFIPGAELDGFYRNMSLYHHPNIVVTGNLEYDLINKSHVFRCFSLICMSALSLIKFTTEEIIKKPEMNFSADFYKKLNELVKELHEAGK